MSAKSRRILNAIFSLALITLAGCDGSSGGGNDPGRPNAASNQTMTLDASEKQILLAADGKSLEQLIIAIESIVEMKLLVGKQINMNKLQQALDGALLVHCDQQCAVSEKE